ncbi:MAG: exodeoxyribonuclease VII large subunit, partial [Firmicutes bacterium]|nr:exodeoxyribonuclease VII large subunit [Bacillota bacterium]
MALKPVSVSQLNDYISRVLMTDPLLGNISVTGEISNLKYHSTGHVYFSINDANSKINCFFPSSYVRNLNYELGDGLEVIINGYINVYKKGGTYTLFVRSVTVAGEGNLAMAFQFMKDKLDSEGLFDQAHKKPIPAFPRRIGIVTSETGAAVQDILKIITSRNNLVNITIFPVQVQGNG